MMNHVFKLNEASLMRLRAKLSLLLSFRYLVSGFKLITHDIIIKKFHFLSNFILKFPIGWIKIIASFYFVSFVFLYQIIESLDYKVMEVYHLACPCSIYEKVLELQFMLLVKKFLVLFSIYWLSCVGLLPSSLIVWFTIKAWALVHFILSY